MEQGALYTKLAIPLVLAVRVGKVVFPLFWTLRDHQRNSDTKARIDMLNKFK
jgi:hypothetical protein